MFRYAISRLFSRSSSKQLPSVEEWAERNSKITTPDMIIAAAIVESFAKELDVWTPTDMQVKTFYGWGDNHHQYHPTLVHPTKNITINFGRHHWRSDSTGNRGDGYYKSYDWQSAGTKVNGIEIELKAARLIASAYERLLKQQQQLQETAAKAKAAMQRNEQAWNIAETLLGMKRNEHGALVPVKTAE